MPPSTNHPIPDLAHELALGRAEGRLIIGIDEVGRGPLAGPVLACALLLPEVGWPEGLADSKVLTARWRETLSTQLVATCPYALGEASVAEIDEINILQATLLAMERATAALVAKLGRAPDHALIDGNKAPRRLPCPATTVVDGDAKVLSIAAASIVAKVARDKIMQQLALEYPGYGWESNAGYGSAAHMAALQRLGPTPHHRRSFAPVAKLLSVERALP